MEQTIQISHVLNACTYVFFLKQAHTCYEYMAWVHDCSMTSVGARAIART
jgi:hypothetical protein